MKKQFLYSLIYYSFIFYSCSNSSQLLEKRAKDLPIFTATGVVCGSVINGCINDKVLTSFVGTTFGFTSGALLGALIKNGIPYLEEKVPSGIIETVGGIMGATLTSKLVTGTESMMGPLYGGIVGITAYSINLAVINYKQTKKNNKTLHELNSKMDKRLEDQNEEKNNTDMTSIAIERLYQKCDEMDRQLLLKEKNARCSE